MSAQLADRSRSVGSVIQEWHPEDAAFWARTGNRIANRNLAISIPALLLAFAIWQMFSAVAVSLPQVEETPAAEVEAEARPLVMRLPEELAAAAPVTRLLTRIEAA